MPHIASRDRDSGVSCPRCGAGVMMREVSARHSDRPDEPATWVVASRFCSAGCVLLSSDLEQISRDSEQEQED